MGELLVGLILLGFLVMLVDEVKEHLSFLQVSLLHCSQELHLRYKYFTHFTI